MRELLRFGGATLLAATISCGGLNPEIDAANNATDAPTVSTDAAKPKYCDPLAPFGAWQQLTIFPPGFREVGGTASADELSYYFSAETNGVDIYRSERAVITDSFGPPTLLAAQSTNGYEANPSISADGLQLWSELSVVGNLLITSATRNDTTVEFPAPTVVSGDLNSFGNNGQPFLTFDRNRLWFASDRMTSGSFDLFHVSAAGLSNLVAADELNSAGSELFPRLTADGLTIYFSSTRPGGIGDFDVWRAQRGNTSAAFGTPVPVTELNTIGIEFVNWISPDNCRIYGQTQGKASIATRTPN